MRAVKDGLTIPCKFSSAVNGREGVVAFQSLRRTILIRGGGDLASECLIARPEPIYFNSVRIWTFSMTFLLRVLYFIIWSIMGAVVGALMGVIIYVLFMLWPGLPDSQRNAIIPASIVMGFAISMYGFVSAILYDRKRISKSKK